jgi:cytoskeletal protein RodZ
MKTKTIGEILKEERLRHRMELPELAKRTRIRVKYLKALEKNEFHLLSAAPFVRGYIKTYAELFGVEYQPLLGLLRRDYKESAKGKLIPHQFIKPLHKKRVLWTPVTVLVMVTGGMFVSLLSYVAIQWYALTKPPSLEIAVPQENAVVSSQVLVEGKTASDAVVLVNAQPVGLQPDGTFTTEVFIPREGVASITIEATDRRDKTTLVQRTVTVQF